MGASGFGASHLPSFPWATRERGAKVSKTQSNTGTFAFCSGKQGTKSKTIRTPPVFRFFSLREGGWLGRDAFSPPHSYPPCTSSVRFVPPCDPHAFVFLDIFCCWWASVHALPGKMEDRGPPCPSCGCWIAAANSP